jgi:TolB-like protein
MLRVAARRSTFSLKGEKHDVREVGLDGNFFHG